MNPVAILDFSSRKEQTVFFNFFISVLIQTTVLCLLSNEGQFLKCRSHIGILNPVAILDFSFVTR